MATGTLVKLRPRLPASKATAKRMTELNACGCVGGSGTIRPRCGSFVSSWTTYLILDDGERRLFEEELQAMPTDEPDDPMESKNSWIEEGRKQGRAEALAEAAEALAQAHEEARSQIAHIALLLLHRRFPVSPWLSARVEELSRERLAQLAVEVDVLDISTPRELDRWLREHTQAMWPPYGLPTSKLAE